MNVVQILVRMVEDAQILQEATLVPVILVGKDSIVIKVVQILYNFLHIFFVVASMVQISLLSLQN